MISSDLYLFRGISVLLDAKRHNSSRTTPNEGGSGGPLGWIAGIAVVVLIAFVVFAGIKQRHTASDKPLATTESAPNGNMLLASADLHHSR